MSSLPASVPAAPERRREPIVIESAQHPFSDPRHYCLPSSYRDCVQSVLIPEGLIHDRVAKLAEDIYHDYGSRPLDMICVLKGAAPFFNEVAAALMRLDGSGGMQSCHYIRLKSYVGTKSSGTLKVSGLELAELSGKDVLIVEDIVDTGHTMNKFVNMLTSCDSPPNSIRVVSLLEKRTAAPPAFRAHYVGFSVPDCFVIGHGLDYNEVFRDMSSICVINELGIQRYAQNGAEAE